MELDRAVGVPGPATLLLTLLGMSWAVQAADTCPGVGVTLVAPLPVSFSPDIDDNGMFLHIEIGTAEITMLS
ncbi:hypothetical protein P7K49_001975 [Saguinus oedipus]|uniref:Uncharacterized protein n=1 Tax=Saguinus oedipus TaxID=9490 RepID=A0ABQ9WG32_SAGOE|nr:hypothetical protein P7K49_001975 [Saguinus oedipus]